jgi:hypothetical protein
MVGITKAEHGDGIVISGGDVRGMFDDVVTPELIDIGSRL